MCRLLERVCFREEGKNVRKELSLVRWRMEKHLCMHIFVIRPDLVRSEVSHYHYENVVVPFSEFIVIFFSPQVSTAIGVVFLCKSVCLLSFFFLPLNIQGGLFFISFTLYFSLWSVGGGHFRILVFLFRSISGRFYRARRWDACELFVVLGMRDLHIYLRTDTHVLG